MKTEWLLFLVVLITSAGCATYTRPLEGAVTKEGVEIYLSGGRGGPVRYDLLSNAAGEIGIDQGVQLPNHELLNIIYRNSGSVSNDIKLVSTAVFSNVFSLVGLLELPRVVEAAKEYQLASETQNRSFEQDNFQYVEVGPGKFRISTKDASWKVGILISESEGWVFVPPVDYLNEVLTEVDDGSTRIAFGACESSAGDNRRCFVEVFNMESKSRLTRYAFQGFLEDFGFSCNGDVLYVLWKRIDIKHGPIDSLFAFAGHPNSDNDYKLTRVSMETGQKRTIEIANNLSPGSGDISRSCGKQGSTAGAGRPYRTPAAGP